jgi:hypothetical protein
VIDEMYGKVSEKDEAGSQAQVASRDDAIGADVSDASDTLRDMLEHHREPGAARPALRSVFRQPSRWIVRRHAMPDPRASVVIPRGIEATAGR